MKLTTRVYDGVVKSAVSGERTPIRKGKNILNGYYLKMQIEGEFGKESGRRAPFNMPMEMGRLSPADIRRQRVIAFTELCPTSRGDVDTYKTLLVMSGKKIGTYRYRTPISEEEEQIELLTF